MTKELADTDVVKTVQEAAAYLRLHPATIRKLIVAGEIPATKVGNHWRIRAVELHALLEPKAPSARSA